MICGSKIVARIEFTGSDLEYPGEAGKFLRENKIFSSIMV